MKGKLEVFSTLELDSFNQYPISLTKWEIERTTHCIRVQMGELSLGDTFGFSEIFKGSALRMSKVKALIDTHVLFLSTKNFKSWFSASDISLLVDQSKIK
mmetsp:Transcript_28746/g.25447  ORF Transcript_28746/g.25447 Transcript_28746/m.25447 type:complete len:100 (+) Transcript_28746:259-558(+)